MQQVIDAFVDDDGDSRFRSVEQEMGKRILVELLKHYPGYNWHISVDYEQGMAFIRTEFSGKYGVRGPLKDFINDPDMKVLVMHVGEFLERYRLSREGANAEALETLLVKPDGRPLDSADGVWRR